ncbi:MAG TPA: hypothetical protein VMI11_14135 [Actinomycetes bacterium]|nr:hypothetical protein [Actinomycetes bacterium]
MEDKDKYAVVKAETGGAIALPDYIKPATSGAMGELDRDDLVLPRLAVAQPTAPELVRGGTKYIPGLNQGDLFNTLTREKVEQPARVVVVRREPTRAIEFAPMEDGGGIVDRNVPTTKDADGRYTDPRMRFTEDENGETVKPVATELREYVALLLTPTGLEPIVLSFKGTSLGAAKALNSLLTLPLRGRKVEPWARVVAVVANPTKNAKGAYFVFGVTQVGMADAATYRTAEETLKGFSGRKVADDQELESAPAPGREPGSDDAEF